MADCESCKNWDNPVICSTCEGVSDFERVVQTNADRIRAMSDEELADAIANFHSICELCINNNNTCFMTDEVCREGIKKWLQSEAEQKGE